MHDCVSSYGPFRVLQQKRQQCHRNGTGTFGAIPLNDETQICISTSV